MKVEQVNQIKFGVSNEIKKTLKESMVQLKVDLINDFKT